MTTSRALLLLPAMAAAAALVAACAPEEKSGIRITGTLDAASGGTAPLTLDVGNVLGTGLNMSATLDGETVTGSGPWGCYAPLPPDYPNYDLEASDNQTYGFFVSIDPMSWSTGAHAIDGELIHLLVAAPDRYGVAQSGTIYITKAGTSPDQAGNDCGFLITGSVALKGEKDR